jgi:succinate dehydrogenase/fumarate reductase flavoprotein subunit
MTTGAGVLRDADSLLGVLDRLPADVRGEGPAGHELRNLVSVGHALAAGALAREESRGTHTRLDHPEREAAFLGRFFRVGDSSRFHPLPVDVPQPSA